MATYCLLCWCFNFIFLKYWLHDEQYQIEYSEDTVINTVGVVWLLSPITVPCILAYFVSICAGLLITLRWWK